MDAVPVIDLGAARAGGRADRLAAAAAIDAACREIGFFAIRGHGIPDALVEDLRRRAAATAACAQCVKSTLLSSTSSGTP